MKSLLTSFQDFISASVFRVKPWQNPLKQFFFTSISLLIVGYGLAQPALATTLYQLPAAPTESTRIVDEPQVLSRLTDTQLRDDLKTIAQTTGIDVRMVVVSRVEYGESMESLMQGLLDTWYPTPELQTNKILVGIDSLSNTTAIVAGDRASQRVGAETLVSIANTTLAYPARDGGRYNQALYDTKERLGKILAGEPDPGEPQLVAETFNNVERTFATPEETQSSNATTIVIVMLVIATVVPMATYLFYALR